MSKHTNNLEHGAKHAAEVLSAIGVSRWRRRDLPGESRAVEPNPESRPQKEVQAKAVDVVQASSDSHTGNQALNRDAEYIDSQVPNEVHETAASQVESAAGSHASPREDQEEGHETPDSKTTVDSWAALVAEIQSGQLCPACSSSTPILGEGDQHAKWVFLIDAPSTRDSQQQQLLAGRAGKLLSAILAAMKLTREEIYLTSIFKCPPQADLNLTPSCSSLLARQLALIAPRQIVTFGEFTAQTLLKSNDSLPTLRQSVHRPRALSSAEPTRVVSTHSLADVLKQPGLKAHVWQDLCRLLGE